MSDDVNMSMRKFLKQVGVTSQQRIEAALRGHDVAGRVPVRMVLTMPTLGVEHVVEGEIETGDGTGTGAGTGGTTE